MEFSKTIFQAWKVMENSQDHGKSWKAIENDDDVLDFFCKNALEYYDNSYDEQLEIYFYSGKHS